jgi:hypothetical protein
MSPRIPESVPSVALSLATIMRATWVPPRDPNDDDDEEEDDDDEQDGEPAVIREPDEDEYAVSPHAGGAWRHAEPPAGGATNCGLTMANRVTQNTK